MPAAVSGNTQEPAKRPHFWRFVPIMALLFIMEMTDIGPGPDQWRPAPHPVGSPNLRALHSGSTQLEDLLLCGMMVLFGGLHFITWHFAVPTRAELLIWRGGSIILTALPIVIHLLAALLALRVKQDRSQVGPIQVQLDALLAISFIGSFFLCITIRFILEIDSLVLLRDLPPTAFLSLKWSTVIPSL